MVLTVAPNDILKKKVFGHSPFCGANEIPALDFYWHLPWFSKPEWIPHLHAMDSSYSPLVRNLLISWPWLCNEYSDSHKIKSNLSDWIKKNAFTTEGTCFTTCWSIWISKLQMFHLNSKIKLRQGWQRNMKRFLRMAIWIEPIWRLSDKLCMVRRFFSGFLKSNTNNLPICN